MKTNFKDALASNLISVIIIFILLYYFDNSGEIVRNIIIVFSGFLLVTLYDFIKIKGQNKNKN